MSFQAVARVLAKLPSLQSMTQRLRSQSHRVLQPVAQQLDRPDSVEEVEEERRLVPSISYSEAHVMVFVHGFRVRQLLTVGRKPHYVKQSAVINRDSIYSVQKCELFSAEMQYIHCRVTEYNEVFDDCNRLAPKACKCLLILIL